MTISIPVRWGDMDAFGHVNNIRFLQYFEDARIAYFAAAGVALDGVGPILGSTECRFRAPLEHPDTVTVGARVVDVAEDRFTMEYAVWSAKIGRLAASGNGVIVAYDYDARCKATVPAAWRAGMARLEASVTSPSPG